MKSYEEILTREFLELHYSQLQMSQTAISQKTHIPAYFVARRLKEMGFVTTPRVKMAKDKPLLKVDGVQMLSVERRADSKSWDSTCRCRCGKEFVADYGNIAKRRTKSCGCIRRGRPSSWERFRAIRRRRKTGGVSTPHINKIFLSQMENSARVRDLSWNVSVKFLEELYFSQGGKCALSGVEIHLPTSNSRKGITASLDRIDSTRGYLRDNVQWVHKRINKMKSNDTDEQFVQWCLMVARHATGSMSIAS